MQKCLALAIGLIKIFNQLIIKLKTMKTTVLSLVECTFKKIRSALTFYFLFFISAMFLACSKEKISKETVPDTMRFKQSNLSSSFASLPGKNG